MHIVYTRERHQAAEGQQVQNPRFFTAPVAGAKQVTVIGDYPRIVKAYGEVWVPVTVIGVEVPSLDMLFLPDVEAPLEIPADWRDLPWVQKGGEGLTLRRLATSVSGAPVLNKADAVAVIEAALAEHAEAN